MATRRTLLVGSVGALAGARRAWAARPRTASASASLLACRVAPGRHAGVVGLRDDGTPQFDIALPARGHGFAWHPEGRRAVVVARRPGRYLWVLDSTTGTLLAEVDAPEATMFCGHACFDASGTLLYTTEQDDARAIGAVGIWDARGVPVRLGMIRLDGIDPHDIVLDRDGKTLLVAVGGVDTDGTNDAPARNLATLDSQLLYVDPSAAIVTTRLRLPAAERLASLRHISVAGSRTHPERVVALQIQGTWTGSERLLARFDRTEVTPASSRAPERIGWQGYAGSVAHDASGAFVATSHPRGNAIAIWRARDGAPVREHTLVDGCGIAAVGEGRFVASGARGAFIEIDAERGDVRSLGVPAPWSYDNHMSRRPRV